MARNQAAQTTLAETGVEETKPEGVTKNDVGGVLNAKNERIDSHDLSELDSKSKRMRFLASLGYTTGAIAKYLSKVYGKEVKYQFVRNVLAQASAKAS